MTSESKWAIHAREFIAEMDNILGERQGQYNRSDDRQENFENIAAGWSVLLGVEVTPRQVALCNIWLKLAREVAGPKHDSMIDVANYALIADSLESHGPES